MIIIEYTLEDGRIPNFVSDGGYWWNPDGSQKMIGAGVEDSMPDTVETFTLAELQARQRTINAKYPMAMLKDPSDDDSRNMTDDEVNTVVKAWVDARS